MREQLTPEEIIKIQGGADYNRECLALTEKAAEEGLHALTDEELSSCDELFFIKDASDIPEEEKLELVLDLLLYYEHTVDYLQDRVDDALLQMHEQRISKGLLLEAVPACDEGVQLEPGNDSSSKSAIL